MKNRTKNLTAALLLSMATFATAPVALAQSTQKPYTYVEQMPVFKGGEGEMLKFLGQNIQYPKDAQQAGVEGLVVLSFVVGADGSVSNVAVVKSLIESTNAEAVRVVKMTDGKWTPGRQNGKAVPVRYTLPVRFAVRDEQKTTTPDQKPEYKGGQEALFKAIGQNMVLPEEAKKEHLNARVVVKFTVEPNGSVSNIKLADTKLKKTIGPDDKLDYMDASSFNLQNKTILARLAEVAAAAVQKTSGQWQPATKNGQPVAAEVYLPVQFLGSEVERGSALPETKAAPVQDVKANLVGMNDLVPLFKLDKKPTFKEGEMAAKKFYAKNLRYPDTEAEGDVTASFLVFEDGTIGKASIGTSMGTALKEEVLRVVELSKGKWQPGYKDGKAVKTVNMLVVRFVNESSVKKEPKKERLPADVVVTKFK